MQKSDAKSIDGGSATLSLRAYAKKRGVALSAVQKAIATKRIATDANGKINPARADVDWDKNTTKYVPAVTRRDHEEDDPSGFGVNQYTKARAVREHYQARLAKLDYEERVVNLVSKDEVQVAAFNKYRMFRDSMLNIPDRLSAALAAETDPASIHEMLSNEIRKALQEFADANR